MGVGGGSPPPPRSATVPLPQAVHSTNVPSLQYVCKVSLDLLQPLPLWPASRKWIFEPYYLAGTLKNVYCLANLGVTVSQLTYRLP